MENEINGDGIIDGKKRYRLLKLFLVYIAAIAVCLPIAILSDGSKVYAPIFYLLIIAGILLYIKKENCDWRGWLMKPQPGSWVRIIVSAVLVLGLSALLIAVRTALWQGGMTEELDLDIFVLMGSCVFAPIVEEIACRGIVVDILKEKHGNVFVIIVSALIFYALHGNPMNVGAFAFGVLACWMMLKTRNLIPGIILHYVWNTTLNLSPLIAANLASI